MKTAHCTCHNSLPHHLPLFYHPLPPPPTGYFPLTFPGVTYHPAQRFSTTTSLPIRRATRYHYFTTFTTLLLPLPRFLLPSFYITPTHTTFYTTYTTAYLLIADTTPCGVCFHTRDFGITLPFCKRAHAFLHTHAFATACAHTRTLRFAHHHYCHALHTPHTPHTTCLHFTFCCAYYATTA